MIEDRQGKVTLCGVTVRGIRSPGRKSLGGVKSRRKMKQLINEKGGVGKEWGGSRDCGSRVNPHSTHAPPLSIPSSVRIAGTKGYP